ncbi:MAG TPA: thermonuclease family protein [Pyrinomonadaceae bacterium]|nr:thermonuclease family protein [Pyrinomonadaceae bacterium]
MTRYFVLAFLLLAFLSTNVEASTLFGRVVEINDGDVITVFNLNRPVRIRLVAVDAPEASQPFGDVAKKHLYELVYDKSVVVEYWGIASDSSLVGRVLLNSSDIGAQMIRDGAAWFDSSSQDRLSVADREIYEQSEQAARNERRGLWQAPNPVAPWEFVRARALRQNPTATLNSILPGAPAKSNRPTPELTTLSLIASRLNSAASAPVPDELAWAVDTSAKTWRPFKPTGENFSAELPDGGKQLKMPIPFRDQMVDVNVYMVREGWSIYSMMWITAPSYGESDRVALEGTVAGFLKGVGEGYESRAKTSFGCDLQNEKNVSMNGFTGSEFDLPCKLPGKLRAFTKVVNGQRQMYVGAAFSLQEDSNVTRFLKSFTPGTSAKTKRAATKSAF